MSPKEKIAKHLVGCVKADNIYYVRGTGWVCKNTIFHEWEYIGTGRHRDHYDYWYQPKTPVVLGRSLHKILTTKTHLILRYATRQARMITALEDAKMEMRQRECRQAKRRQASKKR